MQKTLARNSIQQKNEFVISMRNYLMSEYHTDTHYTLGEGEFESDDSGGAYRLARKNERSPQDISGFCFRKDLCYFPPQNESDIMKDIRDFDPSVPCKTGHDNMNNMSLEFGDKTYLVTAFIDDGYAGEIIISFLELPNFEKARLH